MHRVRRTTAGDRTGESNHSSRATPPAPAVDARAEAGIQIPDLTDPAEAAPSIHHPSIDPAPCPAAARVLQRRGLFIEPSGSGSRVDDGGSSKSKHQSPERRQRCW